MSVFAAPRKLRLALALAGCVAAIAAFPAVSSAATVVIPICSGALPMPSGWEAGGNGAFEQVDACAGGGGLELGNSMAGIFAGEFGLWSLTLPRGLSVQSWSFKLSGGDSSTGVNYWVTSCDECAPNMSFANRMPGDPAIVVTPDPPIDPGARVTIGAICTPLDDAEYCAGTSGPPAVISEITLVLDDETAPELEATLDGSPLTGDGSFLGWTNKQAMQVELEVFDFGLGLGGAMVEIGDSFRAMRYWDFTNGCLLMIGPTPSAVGLPPCQSGGIGSGLIDLGLLADGTYETRTTAGDAAGNYLRSAPDYLGIDRLPPVPPTGVEASLRQPGWPGQMWTSDPLVDLAWDLETEVDDPLTESPLESVVVSWRNAAQPTPDRQELPVDAAEQLDHQLPTDGIWEASVARRDAAGNSGAAATVRVGLDRDAPPAPVIDPVAPVAGAALLAGRQITWEQPAAPAELESGVCGYFASTDASPSAPLPGAQTERLLERKWKLPANLPDGAAYVHVRTVSCAGVYSAASTMQLTIDATAPSITISGLPAGDGWSAQAAVAQVTASDAGTGVSRVGWSIDEQPVVWSLGDAAAVPIDAGVHSFVALAEDQAGNVASTAPVSVRTDLAAPSTEFAPIDLAAPARVTATAADQLSGLSVVELQLRRVDAAASSIERDWRPLGNPEPIGSNPLSFTRELDDHALPAGDYELRVRALDAAGNSSTTGDYPVRRLRLPLRSQPGLTAAIADVDRVCKTRSGARCSTRSKCRPKQRCKRVNVIRRSTAKRTVVRSWKRQTALVGDAVDADGTPIAGAEIVVSSAATGHDARPLGVVTTDHLGRYSIAIPPGPSREFTAELAGSSDRRPVTATARRLTRTEIEFSPSPRVFRTGRSIELRGRVLHSQWLPPGGVIVRFQYLTPDGYWWMGRDVATDDRGRFALTYPWAARAERSVALLRARVAEVPTGWPFEPGSSRAVRMVALPAR